MHSIFYGKFREKLEDRQKDFVDSLLKGGPQDFAQYKYQVGFLDGLRAALECAEDVDKETIG